MVIILLLIWNLSTGLKLIVNLHNNTISRAYRLYEKRARNSHSDCTVGKILIVAKVETKCVGGAKWKPFSLPIDATWSLG